MPQRAQVQPQEIPPERVRRHSTTDGREFPPERVRRHSTTDDRSDILVEELTGRCRSLTQERDILWERLRQQTKREAHIEQLVHDLQTRLAKLKVLSDHRQNRYEQLLEAYQQLKDVTDAELAAQEELDV
ncbi:hypothetical protein LEN26_016474 [Aphanomyces euteiches]|nr:hypothetical protein LEN26_016474 [Aphanomyces euteiches]KAH9112585.1 hypothetical protein AeMF1_013098 [Aphanomyces euteiches]KAH9190908.1 hypothetical protein AeNC1_007115 [Aphanomyces euteiches]